MKTKSTLLLIALFFAAAVTAQSLYVVEKNQIIYQIELSDIDSISFIEPATNIPTATSDPGVLVDGIRWATRNVGAHGNFAATPQDAGGFYQWGRKGDGHQDPESERSLVSYSSDLGDYDLDANGQIKDISLVFYGKFIVSNLNFDWRPFADDALWNAGSESAPIKTIADACPAGWRIPTKTELQKLAGAESKWVTTPVAGREIKGSNGKTLFLPAAGVREGSVKAPFVEQGVEGYYWSSSTGTGYDLGRDYPAAYLFGFDNARFTNKMSHRTYGANLRCVKE